MPSKLSKKELRHALLKNSTSEISFLTKTDKDKALDVLADAFMKDPMTVWVAQLEENDPDKNEKQYNFNKSLMAWGNHRSIDGDRGTALGVRDADGELVGCMTVSPSSCAKERLFDLFVSLIKLGSPVNYKEKKRYGPHSTKRLESLYVLTNAREKHMKGIDRWIYLQCIGVRPDGHGRGHGKKMIQLLNQTADSLNVPVYLETESKENESLYKHFGFDTVEESVVSVPGDNSSTAKLTMYLMRRNPQ